MEVHQILPTMSVGDAIGNEVLQIQEILTGWGYKSEVYAENIHPQLASRAKKYEKYLDAPDKILIYHYSIGSNISDFVKGLKSKIIIRYHNITPPEFFTDYNDQLKLLCSEGRNGLQSLSGKAVSSLANSEYSRCELDKLGFADTSIMPLIIDLSKYDQYDHKVFDKYDDDFVNLLFVGRILPQKKQEDVVKIFYYYKKYINPRSRLFLVGNYNGYNEYYQKLNKLIKTLNLTDVYLTDMVSFKQMVSYYKLADIFICMSDWESFCVPLVESMYFNIPIIAYNCTAIPSTLGNSGILVNKKRYEEIAELINCILEDRELKDTIIRKEKEQLREFEKETVSKILKRTIERVAGRSGS